MFITEISQEIEMYIVGVLYIPYLFKSIYGCRNCFYF